MRQPAILNGVIFGRMEVGFRYTTRAGAEIYVDGMPEEAVVKDGEIVGIRVRVNFNSKLDDSTRELVKKNGGILACKLDRIIPNEHGLIVGVSKKELATGTGAARFIRPRGEHVAYAVSLVPQLPADTAIERHTEAEFAAMSRHSLNEWIDAAKCEIELTGGQA